MRQWVLMEYEPKNQNHFLARWPYVYVISSKFQISFFVKYRVAGNTKGNNVHKNTVKILMCYSMCNQ